MTTDQESNGKREPWPTTDLDEVFQLVRSREGIDLTAYRRSTVERRVTSRLQKLRYQGYREYAAYLAENPDESQRLVEHITIKVSRFFRDIHVYDRLCQKVFPDLVQIRNSSGEMRIWSAGCGNGEEVYSLAILLEEISGQKCSEAGATIWGTDVDKVALATARRGLYPESALGEIQPALIPAYFASNPGRFGPQYEIAARLRENVRFLHHDLLSEVTAPGGSQFHLIMCRNVLIYFERDAQERVLCLLSANLAPGGYLCLGEAEQLSKDLQLDFETTDRQARLYRKIQRTTESV